VVPCQISDQDYLLYIIVWCSYNNESESNAYGHYLHIVALEFILTNTHEHLIKWEFGKPDLTLYEFNLVEIEFEVK